MLPTRHRSPHGRELACAALAAALVLPALPAAATGTAQITQRDGTVKRYADVRIAIRDAEMWFTSSDGRGTIVLGKAACTKQQELLVCLPYDATLFQNGEKTHIRLKSGTVWFNPTGAVQPLPQSSMQLPPRGVSLVFKTANGTYVTLNGVVDEVQK